MSDMLQKSALPICSECLGTTAKNQAGETEELTVCAGCGSGVHPSCVPEVSTLLSSGPAWPWYCEDCRLCAGCTQPKEQVHILNNTV